MSELVSLETAEQGAFHREQRRTARPLDDVQPLLLRPLPDPAQQRIADVAGDALERKEGEGRLGRIDQRRTGRRHLAPHARRDPGQARLLAGCEGDRDEEEEREAEDHRVTNAGAMEDNGSASASVVR